MSYKVYYKGNRTKIQYKGNTCVVSLKEKINKHRAEIEAYMSNMSEPTISRNNNTITLTFNPIPQQMAQWMVQSKTVFFNVVRQNIGHRNSNSHGRKRSSRHTIQKYFPYEWDYVTSNDDPSIPNTSNDYNNRQLTVNELTSGTLTRNVRHDFNLYYGNGFGDVRENCGDWAYEFYMGLIYWDEQNEPRLYKMAKVDIFR